MYVPVVIEQEGKGERSYDLFSRLLKDRIVRIDGEITAAMASIVTSELLFLESQDPNADITMYINSPGGSVVDGLGLIDTMNYIKPNISTTCIGIAASMGAVLLSNGTEGKRFVLPHSRVMIHQVSSSMRGTVKDMEIEFEQTQRCKQDVYKILSENTKKSYEEIEKLCDRNNWFIGQEAVDLHIADKVLSRAR